MKWQRSLYPNSKTVSVGTGIGSSNGDVYITGKTHTGFSYVEVDGQDIMEISGSLR